MSYQIVEGIVDKREQIIVPFDFSKNGLKERLLQGRIGGYRIHGILGGGKYGLVLEVSEREENRIAVNKDSYALKVVFCSVEKTGKFVRHDLDVSTSEIEVNDEEDDSDSEGGLDVDSDNYPSSQSSLSSTSSSSSVFEQKDVSTFRVPSVKFDNSEEDKSASIKRYKKQFNRFCGDNPEELYSISSVRKLFSRIGFASTRFDTLLQEVITNLNIDFSDYNVHYRNLLTFRDYWVECSRVDPETKMATEFAFFLLMAKCKGTLMDYLDGGKDKTLTTCERYYILAEIATGLAILHRNGIAHGDLHVGNILWREVGLKEPNKEKSHSLFCIGDFGRSKYFKHRVKKTTDSEAVWWTKLTPEKRDLFFFYNLLIDVLLPRSRQFKIYLNEYRDILKMLRHFAFGRKEIEKVPGFEPLYKLIKKGGIDINLNVSEIVSCLRDIIQTKLKKDLEVTKKLSQFGNADYFFSADVGDYHEKKLKKEKRMREKLMKKLRFQQEEAEEKQVMMELEREEEERKRIEAEEKVNDMVMSLIKMGTMTDSQIMMIAKIDLGKLQELKKSV